MLFRFWNIFRNHHLLTMKITDKRTIHLNMSQEDVEFMASLKEKLEVDSFAALQHEILTFMRSWIERAEKYSLLDDTDEPN